MSQAESFSAAERERLAPFVSDLDAPVFALRNLPEATRGALFARYSRYPGTLRRLMLDEFSQELSQPSEADREGARTGELFERVLVEYGDDSVAQLGGAHIACEWVSNLLTKILQRPRLGAYLEQSTRYIAYDRPMPDGRYRYYRDAELGEPYERAMDSLFATYSQLLEPLGAWLAERFPARGEPAAARRRAIRAKSLDLLRGLLPAGALSHVGIFASGQTIERLILHLLADPLPEAQLCGQRMLSAMQATMPSFVARVQRPDRGGQWIAFLRARAASQRRLAGAPPPAGEQPSSVRLLRAQGDERQLLAALLFEGSTISEADLLAGVERLGADERAAMIAELAGGRVNRRHLPGRGFEALRYRFEVVSDYGAFRDLQRHRMLTVQWQGLSAELGAEVPQELSEAGCEAPFRAALERSREAWQRLRDAGLAEQAPYALCMAHRVRYVLDLDAREAIHLIELRSQREGHAAYRRIAQEMHRQIAAVHPAVAAAMTHLDASQEPRLERLAAEPGRADGGAP